MIHKTDWTNDVSIVDDANLNRIEGNIEELEGITITIDDYIATLISSISSLQQYIDKLTYRPILWEGSIFMNGLQKVYYIDKDTGTSVDIDDLPNGIILYFSNYADGVNKRSYDHSFVVTKQGVLSNPGYGNAFSGVYNTSRAMWMKYLYIYRNHIAGNDLNSGSPNNNMVLTKIVGF